jgi:ABC-type uncharacterized transport system substrate-binding protein
MMRRNLLSTPTGRAALGAAGAAFALVAASGALAHPHVWIAVESTVVYENGTITGLAQKWIFDDFYTASAIQGLDSNNDGNYDRSELAELADANIEGLKEFDYFTYANLAGQPIEFGAPKDYWLELAEVAEAPGLSSGMSAPAPASSPPAQDGQSQGFWSRIASWWSQLFQADPSAGQGMEAKSKVLALNFTLPLKQPVLADAEGFEFVVQDPSYFIWFDFAKDNPVRLSAAAPAGCKAVLGAAEGDVQRLTEAFSKFGGAAYGASAGKAVKVTCPRS